MLKTPIYVQVLFLSICPFTGYHRKTAPREAETNSSTNISLYSIIYPHIAASLPLLLKILASTLKNIASTPKNI